MAKVFHFNCFIVELIRPKRVLAYLKRSTISSINCAMPIGLLPAAAFSKKKLEGSCAGITIDQPIFPAMRNSLLMKSWICENKRCSEEESELLRNYKNTLANAVTNFTIIYLFGYDSKHFI